MSYMSYCTVDKRKNERAYRIKALTVTIKIGN